MANNDMNTETAYNVALYEFAAEFYKKTGQRLERVEFNWIALHAIGGEVSSYWLRDLRVIIAGDGRCRAGVTP